MTVQDWTIACTVQDGETVLSDFTGANALHYPSVLSTFTGDQQQEIIDQIKQMVVLMKAGLW